MSKRHEILLVDDDQNLTSLLAFALELEGARVQIAHTGGEMFRLLRQGPCELLVLDLGLPDEDGLVLTRQVRSQYRMPILILTGRQDRESFYAAMELGANDYITKPFDPRELLLRARNLLGWKHPAAPIDEGDSWHHFFGWRLDEARRILVAPEGEEVELTPGEFRILARLAKSFGHPVSRHELLDVLAQGGDGPSLRMIDVYVTQIRKKIALYERDGISIVSVRGYGYRLKKMVAPAIEDRIDTD